MVGTSTLKFYKLENLEEYDFAILKLYSKGNTKQAGDLFERFDFKQKKEFITQLVLKNLNTEFIHFIKLL